MLIEIVMCAAKYAMVALTVTITVTVAVTVTVTITAAATVNRVCTKRLND